MRRKRKVCPLSRACVQGALPGMLPRAVATADPCQLLLPEQPWSSGLYTRRLRMILLLLPRFTKGGHVGTERVKSLLPVTEPRTGSAAKKEKNSCKDRLCQRGETQTRKEGRARGPGPCIPSRSLGRKEQKQAPPERNCSSAQLQRGFLGLSKYRCPRVLWVLVGPLDAPPGEGGSRSSWMTHPVVFFHQESNTVVLEFLCGSHWPGCAAPPPPPRGGHRQRSRAALGDSAPREQDSAPFPRGRACRRAWPGV